MKPLVCLVFVGLLYGPAAHAEREWHEATTSSVRVVSAASAAQTEKIAADVELYFEAAKRIIQRPNIRPLVPVNMLVLKSSLWRKHIDPTGRFDGLFSPIPAARRS